MEKLKLKKPLPDSHKGQNGKLLIIGGSKKYHGAPIFSILAARRFVDLLYFFPAESDSFLISAVKHIPEVIVIDKKELAETISKCDSVLFGIGMSDAKFDISLLKNSKKLVIDGDGFRYLKAILDQRDKNNGTLKMSQKTEIIITPHEGEFKKLFDCEGTEINVFEMARKCGCLILKKGQVDLISNGKKFEKNKIHNQGMTKGGTGDVLSGLVSALASVNDSFLSMVAASIISGTGGNMLFKKYGYNYCATDLADMLSESYKKIVDGQKK